ncbi:MAG: aminoglycoside 3'-phosphotransferase [Clostridia bacterium]|nr:aminoglycoside 3'-phosphotransferase [Clostridia bacterium]
MNRTPISLNPEGIPEEFLALLQGTRLYDSSCSPEARVIYLDRDGGYFLKSAPKGALSREADMGRYFFQKGLGAEILSYRSEDRDWLLSRRVAGEDCTHESYISDPKRLCDTLATLLRSLHEESSADCPVPDHTACYLRTVEQNYRDGMFDPSYLPPKDAHRCADLIMKEIVSMSHLLTSDTLLHGDYCLPNIVLKDWAFSGFIDLGNGGVGDRHVDLFWGAWTLNFNLKTDRYRERFFDAYGRDRVDPDRIRLISLIEAFG